jgi:hypothetical protein
MSDPLFLIWSFEHHGWRAPGGLTYVVAVAKAARFTLQSAKRVCLRANSDAIKQAIVPLPENLVAQLEAEDNGCRQ